MTDNSSKVSTITDHSAAANGYRYMRFVKKGIIKDFPFNKLIFNKQRGKL